MNKSKLRKYKSIIGFIWRENGCLTYIAHFCRRYLYGKHIQAVI